MKPLIYSHNKQYLEGLLSELCNFHMEGFQICKNWLKPRTGSPLNNEDIQQYQQILMILKEIVQLMEEIKIGIQLNQLKNMKVFEKVQVIVAEKLGIEPEQAVCIANYTYDLNIDSLDTLEIVAALEQAFNIQIPNQVASAPLTLQKIVSYIQSKS
ncbi:acyl carrier protein [Pelatocladus sp. BLCC-F211]|uniref:acyl carrier protein n=1 Tax=Pelatocladus sp. BLCC-F211 TaxID=3342752 RepID=UPI0035B96CA2